MRVFEEKDWSRGIQWYLTKHHVMKKDHEWLKPVCVKEPEIAAYYQSWLPNKSEGLFLSFSQECVRLIVPLLWLIEKHRSVRDLFKSAPLLSLLVMIYGIKNGLSASCVDHLCSKKRLSILQEIGAPSIRSLLTVLGKIQSPVIDTMLFSGVENIVHHHLTKYLNRLPKIPVHLTICPVNALSLYQSSFLKYGLHEPSWKFMCQMNQAMFCSALCLSYLRRSAESWEFHKLQNLFEDCCRIEATFFDSSTKQTVRCKRFNDLEWLHQRLIELQLTADAENEHDAIYPLPPILGTKTIKPIESLYELRKEGMEQQNCVGSYDHRISTGFYYVYKMLQPQRATIGLKIDMDGAISCDDIKLKYNDEASEEVYEIVESWLHHAVGKTCTVDELGINDVAWFNHQTLFPCSY